MSVRVAFGVVEDPLAGLAEPPYHPEGLEQLAAAQVAASQRLTDLATTLRGQVLGAAWTGAAADGSRALAQQLATVHDVAARAAGEVAGALRACAGRWRQAHATYAQARALADAAVGEEASYRREGQRRYEAAAAAGDALSAQLGSAAASGADGYASPLRSRARQLAEQAVGDYEQAAVAASAAVGGAAEVFALPPAASAPAAPPTGGGDRPWWQDAFDWGRQAAGAVGDAASCVVDFGSYAVANPAESFKVGLDMGLSAAGVVLMALGAGGEAGGLALDTTGIGAILGVPLNIVSAGAIALGAGVAETGALLAEQDMSTMWNESAREGRTGASQARPGGYEPRNPDPTLPDIPQRPPAPKPQVRHWKLRRIVGKLWSGTENPNHVGDGTTMDAVRNELRTGRATEGKFHLTKAEEAINALTNWSRTYKHQATEQDLRWAEQLLRELRAALRSGNG